MLRLRRREARARTAVAFVTLLLAACTGAAPSDSTQQMATSPPAGPPDAVSTADPGSPTEALPIGVKPPGIPARAPIVLDLQVVRDPAAQNVDAVTFLRPEGWQASGSVQWLPEWERLAQLQTTLSDPLSGITIDWLPIQDFIWFEAPAGFTAPIGGNYQGKAYMPPVTDPAQFIADFWMPNVLSRLQNGTLVRVDQVPVVAEEFARQFGGPAQAFAYRLRYQYVDAGQPSDDEVSFALLYSGANGITSWYVNFAYSVRAPQGQLDRNAGLISAVIASRITTPQWEAIYRLVQQLFTRGIQQQMADTEAFGRTLAQYRAETAALQAQVTQERQASQDRIADLRGEALLGVDTYVDPVNQAFVQLPSGWTDYWVNDRGQYLASDPGQDPDSFGSGGWRRLQLRP